MYKMKTPLISLLVLLVMSLTVFGQDKDAFAVQATIEHGIIEGNYNTHDGIQSYLGVPFAKPPVGELRWKEPQPLEHWDGTKETKAFGPRPMQTIVFGDMKSRSRGVSEDCLYLNIWTPALRNTKDLPVLVYFYGGGNVAGDASERRYDGESMAKKGIVVVSANYRLNVFGFLAHPQLSAEAPYKASGNYGLLDQHAALQWVQKNVSAFGGNPSKVTIAGESAGSMAVSLQMVSPLSRDLIAGAIGESGAAISRASPVLLKKAEKIGLEFVEKAGFQTIEELRKLSSRDVYEIYNESKRFRFPTVIDGYFLAKSLPEIFNSKEQAQVPLLLGWNSAEIPGKAFMQGQSYTEENYINKVKEKYPQQYDEVLELYPHGSEKEIEYSATALASDRFIVYSTWKWFDLHRKNSNQPVFRYLYNKVRPPLTEKNLVSGLAGGTVRADSSTPEKPKPVGAAHASEIEYCMGNLHLVDTYAWTEDDYKVSETMHNYFANFIKSGNPNGEKVPEWPAAKPNDPEPDIMIIDIVSGAEKASKDARYVLMDKIYQN
jgi:para-nitrobenzyl esterase